MGLLLGTAAVACLVEGAAAFVSLAVELSGPEPIVERRHTRHDPLLGWRGIPGVRIADLYGPGMDLRTNARGERADTEHARERSAGRTRLVCIGGSYVLGYGVANEHVWTERLVELDPRLETVNLGQGGYGLDQTYLHYEAEGRLYELDRLVLGLNLDNIDWMRLAEFHGYGKPQLALADGRLVARNVPVPSPAVARLRAAISPASQLAAIRFLHSGLYARVPAPAQSDAVAESLRLQTLVDAVFVALDAMSRERGGRLTVVYLPSPPDVTARGERRARREILLRQIAARGIDAIDLTPAFERLSPQALGPMFAQGHYSIEGNAFVAQSLSRALAPRVGRSY